MAKDYKTFNSYFVSTATGKRHYFNPRDLYLHHTIYGVNGNSKGNVGVMTTHMDEVKHDEMFDRGYFKLIDLDRFIIPMSSFYLDLNELDKEISIITLGFNHLEHVHLDGKPKNDQLSIFCDDNPYLKELVLPDEMDYIDCSYSGIADLNIPSELRTLFCFSTNIRSLTVPPELVNLHCGPNVNITNFDEIKNREEMKLVMGDEAGDWDAGESDEPIGFHSHDREDMPF